MIHADINTIAEFQGFIYDVWTSTDHYRNMYKLLNTTFFNFNILLKKLFFSINTFNNFQIYKKIYFFIYLDIW